MKARHVAGLTQEALARRLGISKKTVVRGEGGGTISRPLLVAWALACRVNVAWLLTDDPGDEAVWADMSPVTLDNQDVPVPLAA